MRRYKRTGVQLRIARARLLSQLASHSWNADRLADLQTFARQIGDFTNADTLPAFRVAQEDALRAAQAELSRLA